MFDDVITLIHEVDESTTEETEVFASVESAGQNEFFKAAQTGMEAQYKISVRISDYDGETLAKINGKTLNIYRTFLRRDGKIELYLGRKVGV